ncbi:MAG: BON domain-containing protein [Bryobacterales bacterium]|jgi:hyperosmotically inducible periplasmic protein|nr:BON domain-containing protein [Bryobacterales bacterium]
MRQFAAVLTLVLGSLAIAPAAQLGEAARERLVREVRKELVMLPFYNLFDNFGFAIADGGSTIILRGKVTRPTLKTDAERVVKRIEGVEKVVNEIEVLPLSPNDDRLRIALYRAIYGHPSLNLYSMRAVPPIHILVQNGNVTLEGVVARADEKNIAGIQANSVPGVFAVTNNLVVEK